MPLLPDAIGQFLEDIGAVYGPDLRTSIFDFNEAFDLWCYERGESLLSQSDKKSYLIGNAFRQQKSGAVRYWCGFSIPERPVSDMPYKNSDKRRACQRESQRRRRAEKVRLAMNVWEDSDGVEHKGFELLDADTAAKMRSPHSSRSRSSVCACLACTYYNSYRKHLGKPDLRWPLQGLTRAFGMDNVRKCYSDEQVAIWRTDGLTDTESDTAAVRLGMLPYLVWRGWYEACLDWDTNRREPLE